MTHGQGVQPPPPCFISTPSGSPCPRPVATGQVPCRGLWKLRLPPWSPPSKIRSCTPCPVWALVSSGTFRKPPGGEEFPKVQGLRSDIPAPPPGHRPVESVFYNQGPCAVLRAKRGRRSKATARSRTGARASGCPDAQDAAEEDTARCPGSSRDAAQLPGDGQGVRGLLGGRGRPWGRQASQGLSFPSVTWGADRSLWAQPPLPDSRVRPA